MTKCYIDYHTEHIHDQISNVVNDGRIIDIMEITVRFVTEILKVGYKQCYESVCVIMVCNRDNIELRFLYKTDFYDKFMQRIDPEIHIKKFFGYYYDDISHKYFKGKNKLVFRIRLMPKDEMMNKFFKALDSR